MHSDTSDIDLSATEYDLPLVIRVGKVVALAFEMSSERRLGRISNHSQIRLK